MVGQTGRSDVDLLGTAYGGLIDVAAGLAAADLTRATRAKDWSVVDLLFHVLLDAQRVLVTVASPTDAPPDRDAVDYWRDFPPGRPGASEHAEFVRRSVRAWSRPFAMLDQFTLTLAAAVRAAAASDPLIAVRTQGHVLTVADFLSTVVVEATIHHLDLVVGLPSAPAPDPAALAEVRRVLTGLHTVPFPRSWSDTDVALRATGREPTQDSRLPLIG